MNKTTKIIIGAIILVVAVWGGIKLFGTKTGKTSEPIKIGVILPLTGKAANFGEDIRLALEIAKEEVNSKTINKIELVYKDDEGNPQKAISAYYSLRDIEKVKEIIGSISPTTLAIAPLAEQDKVVLITPVSSALTISDAGDFIFRNNTIDKAEIEMLVPYTFGKYKNIAILYDNTNDSTILNSKFFTDNFSNLGGNIILNESFGGGKLDYRTELLKIKSKLNEIDAMFVVALTKDMVVIAKQMNQLRIGKPILSVKTVGTSDFVNNVPKELSEGIIYAEAAYDEKTNPAFWSKYLNKTGRKPAIWAAQGYDTLKIFAEVFDKCKAVDSVCVKDNLYKTDYNGAAGEVKFDEKGDVIKEISIKQIQNGNFVKIK